MRWKQIDQEKGKFVRSRVKQYQRVNERKRIGTRKSQWNISISFVDKPTYKHISITEIWVDSTGRL